MGFSTGQSRGPSRMSDLEEIAGMIRRLNASGWSIGSVAFDGPAARRWLVSGSNGENILRAERLTQFEAWRVAIEQARAAGMLRREA